MTSDLKYLERMRQRRAAEQKREGRVKGEPTPYVSTRPNKPVITQRSALSNATTATPPRPTISLVEENGKARKQVDVLIDIGKQHGLFHSEDGTAFARDGIAVYPIESTLYRERLMSIFLKLTQKGANRAAIRDALDTLTSFAKFDGPEHRVWLRTGFNADKDIIIDLGRPDWEMILITPTGHRSAVRVPNFQRSRAMTALPLPLESDFGRIWKYLNVKEGDRPLVAAWLLAALRPAGPFPLLILSGEQGTGKTSAARFLRKLVDPSASPVRAPPRDIRDLLVGAKNGWVLALDNLSTLSPELSDALCRLSTGGAIAERAYYTNTEEVLLEIQRPVIINGIEDLATRPDLSERSLHIELVLITTRRTEEELNTAFEQDRPHILGGLLDGVSLALRDYSEIEIDDLPRMADFTKWACAGLPALGYSADRFLRSLKANLSDGLAGGVESSPVGRVLVEFVRERRQWQGTSSELLALLGREPEADPRSPAWPKSPKGLCGVLKRLAPALRSLGLEVTEGRTASARYIHLRSKPPLV